jgi:hypothetical protein
MTPQERQYLLALPSSPGDSGRQDLEEFAAWFDITLIKATREFLQQLPNLGAPYLAFIACLTAIDILSGYRYETGDLRQLFVRFIKEYFPANYSPHAEVLYECRKTVIHEFSPGPRAILVHRSPDIHLTDFQGRVILCADALTSDTAAGARAYFEHVRSDPGLLSAFRTRASGTAGGTMVQLFRISFHPDLPPLVVKHLP